MYNETFPANTPATASEAAMFFKINRDGVAASATLRLGWPRPDWSRFAAWLRRHGPMMRMIGDLVGVVTRLG